jgi:hypothetical protein
MYLQPGVKVCTALSDGQGSFDVLAYVPSVLYVRTEDPIVRFVPPDPRYFQADQRENTVVILPTKERIPARTPAILSTRSLTVTLNLRRGSPVGADTQVTIVDPNRARRSAEVAHAVGEAERALEPRVVERFRASELLELANAGAEVHPARGRTIDRNAELIVLRAKEVVRVGNRRFLLFSVQNRSGDPFVVTGLRLSAGERGVTAPWQLAKTTVPSGEEVGGAVELPSSLPRVARVKVRVDEADGKRGVELSGVEIR